VGIIEGGNVITGGNVIPGSGPRVLRGHGAPVAGTTYAGTIGVGELYVDVDTEDLYEYTEPDETPTYTRVDTIDLPEPEPEPEPEP
jgi:hypothetical protein